MRWIKHNGLGCPVGFDVVVETMDPTGECHIGPAGCPMNMDDVYGSSWIWDHEYPQSFEIIQYRIVAQPAAIAPQCVIEQVE